MDRSLDLPDSQVFPTPDAIDFALPSERSDPPSCEAAPNVAPNVAPNENFDGCEQSSPRLTPVDELLRVKHWKPAEPQFCKAIAAHYGQSKRNIQKWFVDLKEIAPWFSQAELRLSDDRYTPLAVELLGHRYLAGSKKKWESVLRELFAKQISAPQSRDDVPFSPTEVLPQEHQRPENSNGDRPSGMVLHAGSSLNLPAIPGMVAGDDTAYLTQIQQRVQEFEALQQEVIAQMQEEFQ